MNRRMAYYGTLPADLDINQNAQFAMIATGFLAEAITGSGTWAFGLAGTQTTVPSLTINVGRGALGQMSVVDQNNPGTSTILDSTDALMKVGINLAATQLTFTAPASSGQSQVFLIQGQMQEADGGSAVLQYWNASNPSVPLAGPGGSGASNNTLRTQVVAIAVVAGAPANTGSQITPAAATGWVPLYTITLSNGQTTISTAQIVQHPAAPFLDANGTGRGLQAGRLLNVRIITSSQTYVPTLGTNSIEVELVGGGGGGGGAVSPSTGQVSAGAGGGSGGYSRKRIIAGFAGAALTIGAGGAGGTTGAGVSGGTTSVGPFVSATGGGGGTLGPSQPANGVPFGVGGAGTGIGGDFNATGTIGQYAVYTQPVTAGAGGSSYFGGGGSFITGSSNGQVAGTAGSGGGGGAQSIAAGGAATGGNGAAGMIIIREYA